LARNDQKRIRRSIRGSVSNLKRSSWRGAQLLLAVLCLTTLFASALLLQAQSGRTRRQPSQTNSTQGRTPTPNRPRRATTSPTTQPTSTTETGESTSSLPPPSPTPLPETNGATENADAANEVDPDEVIRINSNLVPVPVSVTDERGAAVTSLELKDFELRVDGSVKTISDLTRSETPVRMAFLFDSSGSLNTLREFEKQASIRFFRSVLRPVDKVAIFSICTDPILEQNLTNDIAALVRTIQRFGNDKERFCATSLFDTIAQAAKLLRPLPERKVIVMISDGVETTSNLNFDETLRLAQAANCQVFIIQIGLSQNTNLRDLAAERRMQELAAQTGGVVFQPKGVSDLDTAFREIAADLAQQYVLSYYPTDDARDGRFRTIALRINTRPNLRVRTRKGYYTPKK